MMAHGQNDAIDLNKISKLWTYSCKTTAYLFLISSARVSAVVERFLLVLNFLSVYLDVNLPQCHWLQMFKDCDEV